MAFELRLINKSKDTIEHIFIGSVVDRQIVPEIDLLERGKEMVTKDDYLFKYLGDSQIGKKLFVKSKSRVTLSERDIKNDKMALKYVAPKEDFFVTFSNGKAETLEFFGIYNKDLYSNTPPNNKDFKVIVKVDLEQNEEAKVLINSNLSESDIMFLQWKSGATSLDEPFIRLIEPTKPGETFDIGEINFDIKEIEDLYEEPLHVKFENPTTADIEFFQPR